ncbi:MAG: hypothetical protein AB1422_08415 [bacterium]
MKKVMRVTILAMSLVFSLITASSAAVVTLTVGNWEFELGYDGDPAPYFDIAGIYAGVGAENTVHGAAAFVSVEGDNVLEIGIFGNAYDINAQGNITRADYTIRARLDPVTWQGLADYACPHWNDYVGDMSASLSFGEAPEIKETITPPGVK